MGFVQRRILRWVLWVVRHPKLTLGIALLFLALSVVTAKLHLSVSTDQNKLFSPKIKFFADYLRFVDEFPENEATYVVIEGKDLSDNHPVAEWTDLADRITAKLNSMPDKVKPVLARIPIADPNAPGILFDDSANVHQNAAKLKEFLPLAKLWGEKPGLVAGFLGQNAMERFITAFAQYQADSEKLQFIKSLAESWVQTTKHPQTPQVPDLLTMGADNPSDLGYRYTPAQDPKEPPHHLLLIPIFEIEDRTHLTAGADLIDEIRAAVADVAKPFPQFNVGLTGRSVLDADEDRTTDRDGRRSEIVALIVVFIGLAIFLRSIWLAVAAELSLAIAIGWTFGWATISVGQLNLLSTVFLIALIGIGMDYLLQILGAYRREARRYVRPAAIWMRVFRYVGPPVNTACMGAAGAFLVSALTDFKGAAELGIIAGGGLLLCLLSAYTVLPALLVLFPPKFEPRPSADRYGEAPRRTRIRLILPAIWAVLLLVGLPYISRNAFNPNLIDLQAPNLPSVKLIRKLQTWEAVVLCKDLGMLRKIRDAVKDAPTVARTDSILTAIDNAEYLRATAGDLSVDWATPDAITPPALPRLATVSGTLADRLAPTTQPDPASADLLATATTLREFSRAVKESDPQKTAVALSTWQTEFVAQLRRLLTVLQPPMLEIDKIPDQLRTHLVSKLADGSDDYALYIEPKKDLWNRANLEAFEREVEARVATVPGSPDVTGISSDIYHTTGAIEQAFYKATAYALILIFILVLIDLRNLAHTFIAISVLALGLPMLLAVMGLFSITWNFANFFGLPILIGAGHEYGVFMMHRYREAVENPRRVWKRWDPSDRALLMCGFVTCSSFFFFYAFANHKGLRSLGAVMALGTLCIYLATICVVRPLLTWRLESRRSTSNTPS